jgi:putative endonuclease
MAIHNKLGQKGEEIAASYLLNKGYKILARNWRFKRNEIDIIAIKNEILIVFEVKTRTSEFVENLSEIVTRKKQKSIIVAADAFVDRNDIKNEVRFDIIFIVFRSEDYHLQHIKEAYTTTG